MQKIKIITHSGSFHADDVFAMATVKMWIEKKYPQGFFSKPKVEVIRTRDKEIISKGDFIIDIGGEYNPDKKIFDHHQFGGAGKRANDIPFSSFGLVWKEYGKDICGSQNVANLVDKKIVQPVDAVDNGVDLCMLIHPEVQPYFISSLIGVYNFVPEKKKGGSLDNNFLEAVAFAMNILRKEIEMTKVEVEEKEYVKEVYRDAKDKKIIVLNKDISDQSWGSVLSDYREPLYVVKPDGGSRNWKIKTIRNDSFSFKNKKDLPEAWAGKTGEELSRITGVEGSIFCHNKKFIAINKTKEGAIELARLAVDRV